MHHLARLAFVASLALTVASASAEEKKAGRPVTIRVIDEVGQPIPNATVRVPGTEGKRRVTRNGEWTESMLYTVEGDEFVFKKNEFIEFHVAAPEYYARAVKYKVRGRLNYVEIALKAMPPPTAPLAAEDDAELLVRWFQRTAVDEPTQADTAAQAPAPPTEAPPE